MVPFHYLGSVPKRFIVHPRQQCRVRAHKHPRYFDRAPGALVVQYGLPHAPPWSRGAQQENITQSSSSLIAFAPKSSSTTSATGEHGAAEPLSANPSRYLALAHNRKITATCTKMRHGSYSCAKDVGGAAGLICRDTKPKTNTSRLEHKPRPREPPRKPALRLGISRNNFLIIGGSWSCRILGIPAVGLFFFEVGGLR